MPICMHVCMYVGMFGVILGCLCVLCTMLSVARILTLFIYCLVREREALASDEESPDRVSSVVTVLFFLILMLVDLSMILWRYYGYRISSALCFMPFLQFR